MKLISIRSNLQHNGATELRLLLVQWHLCAQCARRLARRSWKPWWRGNSGLQSAVVVPLCLRGFNTDYRLRRSRSSLRRQKLTAGKSLNIYSWVEATESSKKSVLAHTDLKGCDFKWTFELETCRTLCSALPETLSLQSGCNELVSQASADCFLSDPVWASLPRIPLTSW